jgi:hypothetical protein
MPAAGNLGMGIRMVPVAGTGPGEQSEVMSDEISDRLLGNELARAAEALLAGSRPDPAYALQFATVQVLLALYWELRHHSPGAEAPPALEWLSALVCSGPPVAGHGPAR